MTNNQLIDLAIKAPKNAYAPYSKFKVGAAVLLKNGEIITGANIENCSFGLTNCAERSALFYTYSQGFRKEEILKIAVITDTEMAASPCGACRQVMSELLNSDCPIILSNKSKSDIKETTTEELLPYSFTPKELG
jgi:cytidine deaminase